MGKEKKVKFNKTLCLGENIYDGQRNNKNNKYKY